MFEWAWSYVSYQRGARLITGDLENAPAAIGSPQPIPGTEARSPFPEVAMRVDRRTLFRGLGAGAALAAFRADAIARVGEAAKAAAGKDARRARRPTRPTGSRSPQAFDVDRTLVNLNNGGCSPAPAHVLNAMIRDLRFSNEIPVYHMWTVLEPRIESCRRELAAEFGCDPEEMAITRNASESLETLIFGIDLKAGRRGDLHQPELPAHDHVLGAARAARRHRPQADHASPSRRSRRPRSSRASGPRSRRRPGSSRSPTSRT